MSKIKTLISGREKNIGNFNVRRILPEAKLRAVGPFVFFDHMGPATFAENQGMDVRPHPHIGLATVTYLFEGCIQHRDSLGSNQLIEPGAINWMTAGRGIVHSERTPESLRKSGGRINGLQCWVGLPQEFENTEPSFVHYPSSVLPSFSIQENRLKLLLGTAFGYSSPVKTHSDVLYLEVKMPQNKVLDFPTTDREVAAYLMSGKLQIDNQRIDPFTLVVMQPGENLTIEATSDAHLMILGGKNLGPRFIEWNFVATDQTQINRAKIEWQNGPSPSSELFKPVPDDQDAFVPLP